MENEYLKTEIISDSSPKIKMKITHTPTGITVSGEDTKRFLLKDKLLEELSEKLKNSRKT